MEITVKKLTDEKLMQKAIESTVLGEWDSKMTLDKIYRCEHSPIYTQLFWVELKGIYAYVSTHFVRHRVGVSHYVSSRRIDRGGQKEDNRYSPVTHSMIINAMSLINMSKARLCFKADSETNMVMTQLVQEVAKVDEALAKYLVPNCIYRKGCHELQSCGFYKGGN